MINEFWPLQYRWRKIGRGFKLSAVVLDAIEEEYDDAEERLIGTFKNWFAVHQSEAIVAESC